jgi:hypothetical protein
MMRIPKVSRRLVLKGAGGLTLGLPLLDATQARTAPVEPVRFALFVVGANGVAQGDAARAEHDTFWPASPGSLTHAALWAQQAERTAGLLADHAQRLLFLRGVNQPFGSAGCDHQSGDNMCLTSASIFGEGNSSLANGESIDNKIAVLRNPAGREPVTLRAGFRPNDATGYDNPGFISFRGPRQPRAAEPSPLRAYQRMVGITGMDPAEQSRIAAQRLSVNDLLREEIQELKASPSLSQEDRQRLQQHFDAVREIEVGMGKLPVDTEARLAAVESDVLAPSHHQEVIRLHMELLVFAVASGYSATGTLKIGDRIDSHPFSIDGAQLPSFHMISHRIFGDGGSGDPIPNAYELHRQIDRIHALEFKYLLDRLRAESTPTGPLIDQGYTVWTNQLATGWHSHDNQPFVIAGSAGGFLKTAQFVDLGGTTLNRLLNTLLTAAGVRSASGGPVEDFGDPSLPPGLVSEIVA